MNTYSENAMTETIQELFNSYAQWLHILDMVRKENPQIAEAEKQVEAIKKQIQDHAKTNGAASGSGYEVVLSTRASWDTKALEGYAVAHPDVLKLKTETITATVRKAKTGA